MELVHSDVFWTAVTAIATSLLVLAAGVSARIAYTLYTEGVADKKVDRTIDLLNRFTQRGGLEESPEEAYQYLNETHRGSAESLTERTASPQVYKRTKRAYYMLLNYFERVRALRKQDLIDSDLYFREHGYILMQVSDVLNYLKPWFERQTGVDLPSPAYEALTEAYYKQSPEVLGRILQTLVEKEREKEKPPE